MQFWEGGCLEEVNTTQFWCVIELFYLLIHKAVSCFL